MNCRVRRGPGTARGCGGDHRPRDLQASRNQNHPASIYPNSALNGVPSLIRSDRSRASLTIVRRFDTQGVEDRRAQVIGTHRIAGWISRPAVGGSVNGPAAHPGSRQHGRVTVRPVLAPAIRLVDPRRPSELADPDHQGLIKQPPIVEILQQG